MTRNRNAKTKKGSKGSNRSTEILLIIAVLLIGSIGAHYIFQPVQEKQSLQYISVKPTNNVPRITPAILTCQSCSKSIEFSFSVTSTLIKQTTVSVKSVLIMNGLNQIGNPYQASNLKIYYNNTLQTKPTTLNLNVPALFDIKFDTVTSNWTFGTYNLAINLNFGSPFSANEIYTLAPETFILVNGLPNNVQSFVPIAIRNNQSTATAAPYQQMIRINSANYASVENANLSNVEFFDDTGSIVPSWLENGNNKNGMSTYWISLKKGIPANKTINIFLGFASLESNLFNGVTIGEATQLSEFPGQYNNIAYIMNSGLLMQIYYNKNFTNFSTKNYESQLYQAYMTKGTRLNYDGGDFNTTINPMVTPQNASMTVGAIGYDTYQLLGWQDFYNYKLPGWPSSAVANETHTWALKMVGWADTNFSINFEFMSDDGVTLSMLAENGPAFNGSSWLGGAHSPNNKIDAWFEQAATLYNVSICSGTYRFESDYYQAGGPSIFLFDTTLVTNFYHAALPPNNVVPTNNFGTQSYV